MKFKLVIWDCDGCLVDSEVIGNRVEVTFLRELGYSITLEKMLERFTGMSAKSMLEIIKNETGNDLTSRFDMVELNQRTRLAFEASLETTPNLTYALERIDIPMCVASSSVPERLEFSLRKTELYDRFRGNIYSSTMVAEGKPAPDIFLYAASQMNIDPKDCLVIEDSPYGIQAAHAAGMTVFGYTGASHGGDRLHQKLHAEKPHLIFSDMRKLPDLISNLRHSADANFYL